MEAQRGEATCLRLPTATRVEADPIAGPLSPEPGHSEYRDLNMIHTPILKKQAAIRRGLPKDEKIQKAIPTLPFKVMTGFTWTYLLARGRRKGSRQVVSKANALVRAAEFCMKWLSFKFLLLCYKVDLIIKTCYRLFNA